MLAGLILVLATPSPARAEVPVVADGKAMAVIVTADKPGPVAEYAARELVEHVKKATGAMLEVMKESAVKADGATSRIYVGDCKAAREAVIEVSKLPAETFVLRTKGEALFFAGEDKIGVPL